MDMGNVLLVVHSIRVEVIDFIRKILVEKFETVGGITRSVRDKERGMQRVEIESGLPGGKTMFVAVSPA